MGASPVGSIATTSASTARALPPRNGRSALEALAGPVEALVVGELGRRERTRGELERDVAVDATLVQRDLGHRARLEQRDEHGVAGARSRPASQHTAPRPSLTAARARWPFASSASAAPSSAKPRARLARCRRWVNVYAVEQREGERLQSRGRARRVLPCAVGVGSRRRGSSRASGRRC